MSILGTLVFADIGELCIIIIYKTSQPRQQIIIANEHQKLPWILTYNRAPDIDSNLFLHEKA